MIFLKKEGQLCFDLSWSKGPGPIVGKVTVAKPTGRTLGLEKEGTTHKAPVRFGFWKVSFNLVDGSKGLLCCKDGCRNGNKWWALRIIMTEVFGLKKATAFFYGACESLFDCDFI